MSFLCVRLNTFSILSTNLVCQQGNSTGNTVKIAVLDNRKLVPHVSPGVSLFVTVRVTSPSQVWRRIQTIMVISLTNRGLRFAE